MHFNATRTTSSWSATTTTNDGRKPVQPPVNREPAQLYSAPRYDRHMSTMREDVFARPEADPTAVHAFRPTMRINPNERTTTMDEANRHLPLTRQTLRLRDFDRVDPSRTHNSAPCNSFAKRHPVLV